MNLSLDLLIDNIWMIAVMAFILEVAIDAIFQVKFIDELLQSTLTKGIKNILVMAIAFLLVIKMPELKIFYKMKVNLPSFLHTLLSAFILARFANLFHDLFSFLKRRAQSSGSL